MELATSGSWNAVEVDLVTSDSWSGLVTSDSRS